MAHAKEAGDRGLENVKKATGLVWWNRKRWGG